MRPVVTVVEMRSIDEEAQRRIPLQTLVARAGTAVATEAVRLLGGTYGRRVAVIAGKGNNGADGRVAARLLERRGAKVSVIPADPGCSVLGAHGVDLVIDAAFGTGFRGRYQAPPVPEGAAVLAVDVPSGLDADTGEVHGEPLRADVTVTFAALKPGLLQGQGPLLAGRVKVVDIGLDVSTARMAVIEDSDVSALIAERPRDAHKWQSAVAVVAGSPGMVGAASLCAAGAYRAGAGMVRVGIPGDRLDSSLTMEAVARSLSPDAWADEALEMAKRCQVLVIGPGLGRSPATATCVRQVLSGFPGIVVVDADGLFALGSEDDAAEALRSVAGRVVLTPHDGEFARLTGQPPGADRIESVRHAAAMLGAVVLCKGPTTVVADPSGCVRLAMAGTPRLATAGTGDVLGGVIAALAARHVALLDAAALAAHVHAAAAALGPSDGLVAGDLPDLVARWLSAVHHG